MIALETKDLTHVYSAGTPFEKVAVDHVSLQIEQGEFVGIIGHTGSGKSTLIQHFNGLLRPTSGQMLIGGEDMWKNPKEVRRFRFQVGLVFQYPEYQLFEETIYKDIAFGPQNMGLSPEEVDKRVLAAAGFVGLSRDILQKSPFDLSGGQKRRAAIAGVIAMEPQVLILDEPTAGLDPKGREMILGQIKEYHQEKKSTVLLVSHSMEDVANYCKTALVMRDSKVFLHDEVGAVFSHGKEIEEMGLDIPGVSKIFAGLSAKGYAVPANVYTVEQGVAALLQVVKGGGANA